MTYRAGDFRAYLLASGIATSTASSYASYLGRINTSIDGLDEAVAQRGAAEVQRWAESATVSPFDRPSRSDALSALRKYLVFHATAPSVGEFEAHLDEPADPISSTAVFQVEREMQVAVRGQLDRLEPGLAAIDEGREIAVSTGRIDILAKDVEGRHVVIELKAGRCPAGALEQALGYAQALSEERDGVTSVRVVLIAAEFSDRMRAAARAVPYVSLRTYQFSLQFQEVG